MAPDDRSQALLGVVGSAPNDGEQISIMIVKAAV